MHGLPGLSMLVAYRATAICRKQVNMNSTVAIVLLAVIAFLIYRLLKNQPSVRRPSIGQQLTNAVLGDDNEFIVEHVSDSNYPQHTEIEIDVDMLRRPLRNHFLVYSRFDTHFGKSLYEYRIDGTDVQFRLIEDEDEDADFSKRQDVRDGV